MSLQGGAFQTDHQAFSIHRTPCLHLGHVADKKKWRETFINIKFAQNAQFLAAPHGHWDYQPQCPKGIA